MKKAFVKGFKAWNLGKDGSSCPYPDSEDTRNRQWLSGFISGLILEQFHNKKRRRIPKA